MCSLAKSDRQDDKFTREKTSRWIASVALLYDQILHHTCLLPELTNSFPSSPSHPSNASGTLDVLKDAAIIRATRTRQIAIVQSTAVILTVRVTVEGQVCAVLTKATRTDWWDVFSRWVHCVRFDAVVVVVKRKW